MSQKHKSENLSFESRVIIQIQLRKLCNNSVIINYLPCPMVILFLYFRNNDLREVLSQTVEWRGRVTPDPIKHKYVHCVARKSVIKLLYFVIIFTAPTHCTRLDHILNGL